MYKERIAIAPLSYFGVDAQLGIFRVTCSDHSDLKTLFARLEICLIKVRLQQCNELLHSLSIALAKIKRISEDEAIIFKGMHINKNESLNKWLQTSKALNVSLISTPTVLELKHCKIELLKLLTIALNKYDSLASNNNSMTDFFKMATGDSTQKELDASKSAMKIMKKS